jgi:hypothetical protein
MTPRTGIAWLLAAGAAALAWPFARRNFQAYDRQRHLDEEEGALRGSTGQFPVGRGVGDIYLGGFVPREGLPPSLRSQGSIRLRVLQRPMPLPGSVPPRNTPMTLEITSQSGVRQTRPYDLDIHSDGYEAPDTISIERDCRQAVGEPCTLSLNLFWGTERLPYTVTQITIRPDSTTIDFVSD